MEGVFAGAQGAVELINRRQVGRKRGLRGRQGTLLFHKLQKYTPKSPSKSNILGLRAAAGAAPYYTLRTLITDKGGGLKRKPIIQGDYNPISYREESDPERHDWRRGD